MIDKLKSTILITDMETDKGYPEFKFQKAYIIIGKEDLNLKGVDELVRGRKYTPTPKDKIYLAPGCNIPRFKLKNFCQEQGVALVKYKEKADAIFIGNETIGELIKESNYDYVPCDKDKAIIYFNRILGTGDVRYKEFQDTLNSIEADTIHVERRTSYEMWRDKIFSLKLFDEEYPDSKCISAIVYNDKDLDMLRYFSVTTNIYNQDDILKRLNSTSFMNDEMYHSIKRLFESTDIQNHKVAMEAMANCDFERSAAYLLLLVKEFGDKEIYNSPTKKHVNFASLLKFFGLERTYGLTIDGIINSLITRKLLSMSNLKIIMPLAAEQLQEKSRLDHFKVKEMTVSDEVTNALEENVLDRSSIEVVNEPIEEINPNFGIIL